MIDCWRVFVFVVWMVGFEWMNLFEFNLDSNMIGGDFVFSFELEMGD